MEKGTKLIDHLTPENKKEYLKKRKLKIVERSNADKVLRRFANRIKMYGFIRTKPTYFVRESELVVEFIQIHKYSFGPCFRVQTCIRVLNDSREYIALNGPSETDFKPTKYKFDYEQSIESVEACAKIMENFVKNKSVPWYKKWNDRKSLLQENSPLDDQAKLYLKEAIQGKTVDAHVVLSRNLLKIK